MDHFSKYKLIADDDSDNEDSGGGVANKGVAGDALKTQVGGA